MSRRKRRIAVITGTRAEYGLLRSPMQAIRERRELQLQIVVTGMHLLRKFGRTVDEIRRDGWRIDATVRMQRGDDDPCDQAAGLARGVAGIAKFLHDAGTDVVLVLGDRIEAMAGALAGVTTGRAVAHVHGGDIAAGDFDENLRHAITKLAHIHFAATPAARARILQMGERPERVFCVGAPGLDRIAELRADANPDAKRPAHALILQHACGRSPAVERRVMRSILRAVERAGLSRTIVYPNSDRGHTGIIDAIQEHRRTSGNGAVRTVRSLQRDAFLGELMAAQLLVGNSSCGVIEAPVAGTPSVNVGRRQRGRERAGPTVIEADESYRSIVEAVRRARRKRPITPNTTVYGSGHAGRVIARLLATVPIDPASVAKGFQSPVDTRGPNPRVVRRR